MISLASTIKLTTFYGKQQNKPFMDTISITDKSACTAAYSLRRLYAAYTGPMIQVRRSSDNALLNFYGDVNGVLGTSLNGRGSTLASWLGAATGYVPIWYAQNGGPNATQSTTGNQPQVKSTSAASCLYFGGGSIGLNFTSLSNTLSVLTNFNASAPLASYHTIVGNFGTDQSLRLVSNLVYGGALADSNWSRYNSDFIGTSSSLWYLNNNYGYIASASSAGGNNGVYTDNAWNYLVAVRDRDPMPLNNIGTSALGNDTARSLIGSVGEVMLFSSKVSAATADAAFTSKFL
jgi:hypothetical protein